jgi:glucose/mannose-6-phosphate isomerase
VLCSSYSGDTEETLACYAAAEALGAQRLVATTGGELAEAARRDGVPVIGLPAGLQPRAAVGYMFCVAAELAALAVAAPRINTEIDAYRWKTQVNENVKLPAFSSALPEADHNELGGWSGAGGRFAAIFLEDRDQHPRERRRFELTARAVEPHAAAVLRIETEGEPRAERLLYAVMLGDLVSLELAKGRGVDPLPVEAIERFKAELGRP